MNLLPKTAHRVKKELVQGLSEVVGLSKAKSRSQLVIKKEPLVKDCGRDLLGVKLIDVSIIGAHHLALVAHLTLLMLLQHIGGELTPVTCLLQSSLVSLLGRVRVSESSEPVTKESMASRGTRLPSAPTLPRSRLRLPNWTLVTKPELLMMNDFE